MCVRQEHHHHYCYHGYHRCATLHSVRDILSSVLLSFDVGDRSCVLLRGTMQAPTPTSHRLSIRMAGSHATDTCVTHASTFPRSLSLSLSLMPKCHHPSFLKPNSLSFINYWKFFGLNKGLFCVVCSFEMKR